LTGKKKSKGILQILYEHRLIAESNYQMMTLDGQKSINRAINEATSLQQHLLAQCTNFGNELSTLQDLGKALRVVVDLIPKYHTKLQV